MRNGRPTLFLFLYSSLDMKFITSLSDIEKLYITKGSHQYHQQHRFEAALEGKLGAIMQALIDRAGKHYGGEDIRPWVYDWYTPAKSQDENTAQRQESGSDSYRYKIWQPLVSGLTQSELPELHGVIDMSKYSRDRLSQTNQAQVTDSSAKESGLTMEDIRGAVGGTESIPGFSSSEAQKDTVTENSKQEDVTMTD